MKTKELILILLLLISGKVIGQVSLETTLTNESADINYKNFNISYLPDYGYVIYYVIDNSSPSTSPESIHASDVSSEDYDQLCIYSLDDYSLLKQIAITGGSLLECDNQDKRYNIQLSQYLFNADAKIEIIIYDYSNYTVYNENMELVQTLHADSNAEGLELVNISIDDTPNYKLVGTAESKCYIYSVIGDPFVKRETPTAISTPSQLKSTSSLFSVTTDNAEGEYTANLQYSVIGKFVITNVNGNLIQEIRVDNKGLSIPVDLRNQPHSIYLITLLTNDGNIQTIKVVR